MLPALGGLLWVPVTLLAALAQTARNALQAGLTARLGTLGATQVRFLYGFPFALVLLAGWCLAAGEPPPRPGPATLAAVAAGAFAQVLATALMLAAMRERSFAVATALVKTEPLLVALAGVALLGDRPAPLAWAGIGVATLGVALTALRGGGPIRAEWRPVVLGLLAGAAFALSVVGFRAAILGLPHGSAGLRATTILALGLGVQAAGLGAWLWAFDRPALLGSFQAWRASLGAGLLGALASQFWFLGFALTSAANVRTLALVEVLFARALAARVSAARVTPREAWGAGLIVLGIAGLLAGAR